VVIPRKVVLKGYVKILAFGNNPQKVKKVMTKTEINCIRCSTFRWFFRDRYMLIGSIKILLK